MKLTIDVSSEFATELLLEQLLEQRKTLINCISNIEKIPFNKRKKVQKEDIRNFYYNLKAIETVIEYNCVPGQADEILERGYYKNG